MGTAMGYFIYLLAGIGFALAVAGIITLSNRRLEIGALVGVYPLLWGIGLLWFAALLWCIDHLHIGIE